MTIVLQGVLFPVPSGIESDLAKTIVFLAISRPESSEKQEVVPAIGGTVFQPRKRALCGD